ncbi:hypothetical protein KUTeg_017282 [Tegillarca granosa]|uniref:Uncharacterized protein n=1 Tax=Tegillarca granosa TaxID=220873 RepID=A0ABQ9ENP2_TEGGR|nr:hypothetical protein KUTeg_017282 [Tegillarca granosa]
MDSCWSDLTFIYHPSVYCVAGTSPLSSRPVKIHIKKVWSSNQTTYPTIPQWQNGLPYSEMELRTAYFKQVEEIQSLKEQLSLKDKRIRQLEEELDLIRLPGKCGPGESDC